MKYFKEKQFETDNILVVIGYYYRFSLSYHDVSENLKERGILVHPTPIIRWFHEYGNIIGSGAKRFEELQVISKPWRY
ncbi:hypothetical protein [Bacillus thuringiensis]|uniref:hypothetical protein n=1 Tax=Bacillus thuringiensis TaxID=1428 RepID=UPI003BF6F329